MKNEIKTTEIFFENSMTELKGLRIDVDNKNILGKNELELPEGINFYTEDKGESVGGHIYLGSIKLQLKESRELATKGLELIEKAIELEERLPSKITVLEHELMKEESNKRLSDKQ